MSDDGECFEPVQYKKETKAIQKESVENSFENVAREWFTKNKHIWTEGHSKTIISRLELNAFPWLGTQPVSSITATALLDVLRRTEARGAIETTRRVKQICSQVFRYAIATGRAERDPSADLRGALSPAKPKRIATITDPKQISGLLRAIDVYEGHLITRLRIEAGSHPAING